MAAQQLGFGIKFSAQATLDIDEFPTGISPAAVRARIAASPYSAPLPAAPEGSSPAQPGAAGAGGDGGRAGGALRRVVPRSIGPPMGEVRDISFTLVESRDLKLFSGTWRIEGNATQARLLYAVEVQPQPWLPIGLVVDRVAKDLKGNLAAVRDHAESLSANAIVIKK